MAAMTTWRLPNPPQLLVEPMDDHVVCFVQATGATHLFDAFPAEVLAELQAGPSSTEALAAHLADRLSLPTAELTPQLAALLSNLQGLGVLEETVA